MVTGTTGAAGLDSETGETGAGVVSGAAEVVVSTGTTGAGVVSTGAAGVVGALEGC